MKKRNEKVGCLALVLVGAFFTLPVYADDPMGQAIDDPSYWKQFSVHHQTAVPVDVWLWNDGVAFNLWKGSLGGSQQTLLWDPMVGVRLAHTESDSGQEALVVSNGRDEAQRPEFVVVAGDGETILAFGVLDVDEINGYVMLQLEITGQEPSRQIVAVVRSDGTIYGPEGPAGIILPGPWMMAVCRCYGNAGGTTGTCLQPDCDEGKSCGTAADGSNKACKDMVNAFPRVIMGN